MKWFESSVAIAAIMAVIGGPVAPAFAQEGLNDLYGRDRTEVAALPVEEQLDEAALDTLVAPIALYPDALLAQVLVAATYPLQVVKADRLLTDSDGLSDEDLAARIAEEDWDPSVMVLLSGFPTVIQRMAADLEWTEQLGTAMVGQDADVLAAVQRMRTQALDTGWLESNDAQIVERSDDVVTIRPADPEVVYVPSYDPTLAYTTAPTAQTYVAPSTNPLANPIVAGAIAFGGALLIQKLFEDDNDDNDRDRGWGNYWQRSEPFDWRDRQFYPRPDRGWRRQGDAYAWSRERDDHWDRDRRTWAYDAPARADRDRERRAAVAWTSRPESEVMDRAGQLRTVARERPPQPPAAKPRPKPAAPAKPAAEAKPAPKPKPKPAAAKPTAEAKPAPKSKPAAVAKPAPAKKPEPKPVAEAKPAPKPEAKPKPAADAKPKPAAKPAGKKAEAKPAARAKPAAAKKEQPQAKPASKPAAEAKPKPKPDPKPVAQAKPKPKPQAQAKPAAKPAAQAKQKPKQQAQAKPQAKPAAQAKPKPQAQAKPKPKPQAQAKPKPKPQAQAKPKPKPAAKPAAQKKPPAKKKVACKAGEEKCRQRNS